MVPENTTVFTTSMVEVPCWKLRTFWMAPISSFRAETFMLYIVSTRPDRHSTWVSLTIGISFCQ